MIAADGIHSADARKLYPQEGPPIWNGRILWRGITEGDAFLSGRTMIMAGHEILKFVCYPISKQADASGKFRSTGSPSGTCRRTYQWRREDYNRTARLEEFLPWFEDWKFDWLDVPGLIRNCPHAYEYPLVDRDPIRNGRSAGHADGRRRASDVPDRLQRRVAGDPRRPRHHPRNPGARARPTPRSMAYEAERRPATTDLVMLNRRNGPEQVMQLVEERAPDGFDVVTDVLSLQELEDIAANYKRVAGFQVDAPQRQAADRADSASSRLKSVG